MNSPTLSSSTWLTAEQTAPGFAATVRRAFPPDAALAIAGVYAEVVARGGLESPTIHRPEGASFNPRPARICQILLAEGGVTSPDTVCAALWATIGEVAECQLNPAWPTIEAALALDEVRHLHMTAPDGAHRPAALARAERLCRDGAVYPRLVTLLAHATARYERSVGGAHA